MKSALERDILRHIRNFEKKLEDSNTELYDLEWKLYFSQKDPDLKKHRERSIGIYNDLENYRKIKYFKERATGNEINNDAVSNILSRWCEELSREILPTEKLRKAMLHLAEFEDRLQSKRGSFKLEVETGKAKRSMSFEETQNLLKNENDRKIRESVWRNRQRLGKDLLEHGFQRLIEDRNAFAEGSIRELGLKTDASNFYTLRLEQMDFNEEELFSIFRDLKERSDDLTYKLIEERKKQHGIERLEPWDVSYVIYREIKELDELYKRDELNDNVLRTARGFGYDIGSFNLTFDLYPKEGKLDNAFVFPISPPKYLDGQYRHRGDIRLFANLLRGGLQEQRTLFHEWGHLLHCALTKQEFYLFRAMQNNPSLTEGIAMLFEYFPTEEEFITEILGKNDGKGHLPANIKKHILIFRKQERETALLELRLILARVFFERELYSSKDGDPAKIWSKCMSDLLFTGRHDDVEAWVERPHFVTSPVYYQCYAVASLLKEQFYSYIKKKFDRIINNEKVGEYLDKNCFCLGSSLKWDKIVQKMTGEGLTPKPFLEKISGKKK